MSFRNDIPKMEMEVVLLGRDNKNDVDLLRLFGNETCYKILMGLPFDVQIIGSEYESDYKDYLKYLKENSNPPN